MAEAVFGQKCDENVKNDLTKYMSDLGFGGKEFMAHLLELCELEASSKAVPELSQDLGELQVITTRMVNIYKNLCERVENLTSAKLQEYEKTIELKDGQALQIQGFLDEKLSEINDLKSDLQKFVNERDGLLTRVNELTEVNKKTQELANTNKDLASNYKENLEALSLKIKDAEAAVKERDSHLAKIKELEDAAKIKEQEKAAKDKTIEAMKKDHIKALSDAKDKHELEAERELLKLRKEHQDEIDKVRTAANNTVSEHNERVRVLLVEIEALQKKDAPNTEQKKRGPKGKDKSVVNGKNEVNVVNEEEKETGA